MKKNGEYVGVDEKFIPEDEKYVDESLLGDREESERKVKKTAKIMIIGYIIFAIFIFAMIIGISFFIFSIYNSYNNLDAFVQIDESQKEKIMVSSFNNELRNMQGTQRKSMLSGYLDRIVTKNKTNSNHIITVIYKEKATTTEDGIVGIKHTLNDNSQYEVSLDYDANGYINKVTIKDI